MVENFDYEKVSVLNTAYNNTIHPSKIQPLSQPASIKTPLMPHQQYLVQGMHMHRNKMTHGYVVDNQVINGKIGIVGDPSGTGKTLSILSYLATQSNTFPKITSELTNHSTKFFFSHEIHPLSDASSTNLIIVPHSLFGQWKSEIEEHTTMTYTPIETKRFIKGSELATSMITSSVVLTTNKCYKFVQQYANQYNIQWNNIFIDEASSIYLQSSEPTLRFQFLWFITNNWIPLLFKNPSIVKSNLLFLRDRIALHPELENWLLDNITMHYEGELLSISYLKDYLSFHHENRGHIVVRNSIECIESSIKMLPFNYDTVQCKPNISLQSLTSFYLARNPNVIIRSEKIPHLFQSLGIACKDIVDYLPFQITGKHNLIQRKMNENECVICLDKCEYPTIVNCCYNIYCGKCLLKNTLLTYKCPTCREIIDTSSMCCLTPLTEDNIMITKNKTEVCIDIIKRIMTAKMDSKIIIYSAFDNIYYQLFEEIDKTGLKAERLENNIFSLLKSIRNFKEGNTNILFVSNVNIMRGLSLPSTSHLIFYHELPVYELKEVLIHSAQRIGRKQPLSIIHLNSEIQV